MFKRLKEIDFDWDQWNIQKNEKKHGVSCSESESVFFDLKYKLFEDIKHSLPSEKRFILFGVSSENRILMIGFTLRNSKVRIITARVTSRQERRIYEKETE
jgi:uncharacterized DUF497 family protein